MRIAYVLIIIASLLRVTYTLIRLSLLQQVTAVEFTKIRGQNLEITLDKISNSWELKGISKLSIWFIASVNDRNTFSFQVMFTVDTLDRYIDLEFSLLFLIRRFCIYFRNGKEWSFHLYYIHRPLIQLKILHSGWYKIFVTVFNI